MLEILPELTLDQPAACALCGAGSAPPYAIGHRDFGDSCNDAFAGGVRTFPRYGIAIPYHRCGACAFTFTGAFDGWTARDYRAHIYNDDYILADPPFVLERPARNARAVAGIWHDERGALKVLDYGGGSGAFAAELGKLGFDCASCDTFYGDPPGQGRFDLVTCFEVIEHVPHLQQHACFEEMSARVAPGGRLLLSTRLLSPDATVDHDYIGPRNGHVSLHSAESLRRMAARWGFEVVSLNENMHVLWRAGWGVSRQVALATP